MSFFLKTDIYGKNMFYFDGARMIDGILDVVNCQGTKEEREAKKVTIEYCYKNNDDIENIAILKEELGITKMENDLLKTYTRNNKEG